MAFKHTLDMGETSWVIDSDIGPTWKADEVACAFFIIVVSRFASLDSFIRASTSSFYRTAPYKRI